MNSKQIWEETSKRLEKIYDRRETESITYLLLEDLFELKKEEILMAEEKSIDRKVLEDAIERLLNHEPLQYVTGVVYFYGRKFNIGKGVLIPRPETEELVDLVIKENKVDNPKILDVGVGSGCIGVTLALETNGEVIGTDISKKALNIALSNTSRLGASLKLKKNDVLRDNLRVTDLDILVSNPPYIPEEDKVEMHSNVLDHEPEVALFVPNDNPLIFYRRIAEEGIKALKKGGRLYFEIHERFGIEVKELLTEIGYSNIKIHQDMQGKDRMVSATN